MYSRDLQEDRSSWLVIYRPTRALSMRVLSRDTREGAVEFRQEFLFGGPPGSKEAAVARPKKPRVTSVTFTGDLGFPETQLRRRPEARARRPVRHVGVARRDGAPRPLLS